MTTQTSRFSSIDVFYVARGGKLSGEYDFGVWWTDRAARRGMPSGWPRFSVSVVHDTGDVYAKNLTTGEVELLGMLEGHSTDQCKRYSGEDWLTHDDPDCPYEKADDLFEGWTDSDKDLHWIRMRMAMLRNPDEVRR